MSSSTAATAGGGSTSTVTAEAATGWHVFKVQGYSRYKASAGATVGTAVTSAAFSVGGHSWRIKYYPCGCSCIGKGNTSWLCFDLHRERRAAGADGDAAAVVKKAAFKLSLLGVDDGGEPLRSYTRVSTGPDEFSRSTYRYHFPCFIRRATLDSFYLKADCFRIRCDISVVLETRDEFVPPSSDLHRHLGSMLATGVGGDVTFVVGGETFIAHKSVLAVRSPVFMAEFFGGMMEEKAAAARVRIRGIDARAFKAMLHFIYTDSVPEIDEDDKIAMAQHLLVAADRYGIDRLKLICENKLCSLVNESVVVTTLVLAEKHGCRRLKEACFKLLKVFKNFTALAYDEYNYLKQSCPSVVDELLAEHGL